MERNEIYAELYHAPVSPDNSETQYSGFPNGASLKIHFSFYLDHDPMTVWAKIADWTRTRWYVAGESSIEEMATSFS